MKSIQQEERNQSQSLKRNIKSFIIASFMKLAPGGSSVFTTGTTTAKKMSYSKMLPTSSENSAASSIRAVPVPQGCW